MSETVRTVKRRDVHNYTELSVQTRVRLDPRPRSSLPFNGETSLPELTVFGLRVQIDEFVNFVSHIHKKWCFFIIKTITKHKTHDTDYYSLLH